MYCTLYLTSSDRSGVLRTQNYCLQAFFNLAHNKAFAMSIVTSDLMEDFIVACMVHTSRQASIQNPVRPGTGSTVCPV